MEVIILKDPEALARRGADIVARLLERKPEAVLGLATGSTPVSLYRELSRRHRDEGLSFARCRSFNLDEYLGLPAEHPQSYRSFMNEQFFNHIDIAPENTHLPDGTMDNPLEAGPAYEEAIARAGGIDLQILGIGSNGHIGFNEPTSSLVSRTRVKTLTERTVRDNSRFFADEEFQPRTALTMGIATILEARRILLLAIGTSKARAIRDAVEGPVSAMCPASALQMHPRVTILLDEEAAAALELREYYLWVLDQQDELTRLYGDPR